MRSAWDDRYRVEVDVPLPPSAQQFGGVEAGADELVRASVTAPTAGYYRVVVSAVATDAAPLAADGTYLQNTVHRALWMLVDCNR
jgi:hypothetical protein